MIYFLIKAIEYSIEKISKASKLLGVPEKLDIDVFEGRSGVKVYDWLKGGCKIN